MALFIFRYDKNTQWDIRTRQVKYSMEKIINIPSVPSRFTQFMLVFIAITLQSYRTNSLGDHM
jgi:hypothetical protein